MSELLTFNRPALEYLFERTDKHSEELQRQNQALWERLAAVEQVNSRLSKTVSELQTLVVGLPNERLT